MNSQPLKLLALSGSLRERSSNLSLLRAAQQLAPATIEIEIYDRIGELPHFNPDLDEDNPPDAVAHFRAALEKAAGVIICTPEYAHGLPGSFKNALDWTVSSGNWMEKPTLILKSSRSNWAHDSLVEILTTIMAPLSVAPVELSGNKMDTAAMLADAKIAATLRAALEHFTVK
jgi:NAD(P)H-dependent FMN reductase